MISVRPGPRRYITCYFLLNFVLRKDILQHLNQLKYELLAIFFWILFERRFKSEQDKEVDVLPFSFEFCTQFRAELEEDPLAFLLLFSFEFCLNDIRKTIEESLGEVALLFSFEFCILKWLFAAWLSFLSLLLACYFLLNFVLLQAETKKWVRLGRVGPLAIFFWILSVRWRD